MQALLRNSHLLRICYIDWEFVQPVRVVVCLIGQLSMVMFYLHACCDACFHFNAKYLNLLHPLRTPDMNCPVLSVFFFLLFLLLLWWKTDLTIYSYIFFLMLSKRKNPGSSKRLIVIFVHSLSSFKMISYRMQCSGSLRRPGLGHWSYSLVP